MNRIPTATYRLQLHAGFGFDAAAEIADYLADLGISHVYSSPYLQAAPESTHGYDVVDHHRVNDELGGSAAHDRFCKRLGECHLGQVLDIVPNHMAISGRHNRLWWDVLENGPSSRYSTYFDIDWEPQQENRRGKMLVPILGDHYGRALEKGELKLTRRGSDFFVQYFENEFPAAPRSLPFVLSPAAERAGSDYLAFLSDSLKELPAATVTDEPSMSQRNRDKAVIFNLLDRLFTEVPFIGQTVDAVIKEINSKPDALHAFMEQQNYRLAHWRTSKEDLGYRRFFDVNTLVGLRMESPNVFADTHAMILRWLREGVLDGIRIDHPDGLRDPKEYFERLRQDASEMYIVAEKILEPGEVLPPSWPIDGTTGYDYLNQAGGVFINRESEAAFTDFYAGFTGCPTDYAAVCRDKKHRVLRDLLGSDVNRLTKLFLEICELHRDRRDFTRDDIVKAIRELVASFPVYRTYVVPERNEITDTDIAYVNQAVGAAKSARPEIDPELFDFIADVLLLRTRGHLESEFVYRFQQFCGPAMAKGVEDTVFYNYNRFVALNEVGGDPGVFGLPVEEFHAAAQQRAQTHPRSMLASSTHDTKRSEDVRARLAVLSEIPDEWFAFVRRWSNHNGASPDRNTEYLLYQTLVGAWPIEIERVQAYMEKAAREAKAQTSWITPNPEFETALKSYIEKLYADNEFLAALQAFVERIRRAGYVNSLSQAFLKLTAPGIPDIYQGTELWNFSLVDPDNRRPVAYDLRRECLKHLKDAETAWTHLEEGVPKLWLIKQVLEFRRKHRDLFDTTPYTPLNATGSKADHALAFLRGDKIAAICTRLPQTLGAWDDTQIELPDGNWKDIVNGKTHSGSSFKLRDILHPLPVSLLVKS